MTTAKRTSRWTSISAPIVSLGDAVCSGLLTEKGVRFSAIQPKMACQVKQNAAVRAIGAAFAAVATSMFNRCYRSLRCRFLRSGSQPDVDFRCERSMNGAFRSDLYQLRVLRFT